MKKIFLLCLLLADAYMSLAQSRWQVLPDTGLTNYKQVRYEDVYFTDSLTGFAVNLNGYIYRTRDAGRNWTVQLSRPGVSSFRSIEFLKDGKTGIAGCVDTAGNVYRTSDGGNTWTNIMARLPDTILSNRRTICGIAHWDNTFYAVGAWFTKQARLFKSTDKGLTWTCLYLDTSLISSAVDICFTSRDTGFITGGYSTGFNGINYYSSRSVVLKTTDGGLSWKRVFSNTSIGGRIWKIQAVSNTMLVGSIEPYFRDSVAMIKSTDGGDTWTIIKTGFNTSRSSGPNSVSGTQGIGFIDSLHGWLGGYYNGLFETMDGGQTWDTLNFGNYFNRFFVLDSTHIYAGGQEIYFYGHQIPGVPKTPRTGDAIPHWLYPVIPNPSGGLVKIEFDLMNTTHILLQVAGVDSKRSWEVEDATLPSGHYEYYWDGSAAPSGNYIVWLGTNEVPIVQKFTILH